MIADSIKQDSCTSPRGCELNPESWRYGKFAKIRIVSTHFQLGDPLEIPFANHKRKGHH